MWDRSTLFYSLSLLFLACDHLPLEEEKEGYTLWGKRGLQTGGQEESLGAQAQDTYTARLKLANDQQKGEIISVCVCPIVIVNSVAVSC